MLRLIRAKLARFNARKRLAATLRPDPDFRERRLAQFTTERRQRYFDNVRKAGL